MPSTRPVGRRAVLRTAGIVLVAVVVVIAVVLTVRWHAAPAHTILKTATGTSNSTSFRLETATTPAAQQKGLGGRDGLAADGGMLFRFSGRAHERCIWMKDMKFSIDVLWLDDSKRVVKVAPGLKPETYPETYCAPAEYVIELPAGTALGQGIRTGQILEF